MTSRFGRFWFVDRAVMQWQLLLLARNYMILLSRTVISKLPLQLVLWGMLILYLLILRAILDLDIDMTIRFVDCRTC